VATLPTHVKAAAVEWWSGRFTRDVQPSYLLWRAATPDASSLSFDQPVCVPAQTRVISPAPALSTLGGRYGDAPLREFVNNKELKVDGQT